MRSKLIKRKIDLEYFFFLDRNMRLLLIIGLVQGQTVFGWNFGQGRPNIPSAHIWEYPYNPNIHMFGNHGFLGRIHAEIAPGFTRFIDKFVYHDDIRSKVLKEETEGLRVLDIGCGIGMSTSDSDGSVGIDVSVPMIEKAMSLYPNKEFEVGRGEIWEGLDEMGTREFDIVTFMYVLHETPREARIRLLARAKQIAKKKVIVLDISPLYEPSVSMLLGEPYLKEYLCNVKEELSGYEERELVWGHAHCWVLRTDV